MAEASVTEGARSRDISDVHDAAGQVLTRSEAVTPTGGATATEQQFYYYFNGRRVASVGALDHQALNYADTAAGWIDGGFSSWPCCLHALLGYSARMRSATITRTTGETDIAVTVNLDGSGEYAVSTGIGFLDHMIEQLSRHSLIDIDCKVDGDLHVDQHHTTEDSAIAIGEAVAKALGDKAGIRRYGSAYSPMDETLSRVALDISGRPFLVWNSDFTQERLGEMDTELFKHWFHSFAGSAGITLHVETLYGENNHHIIESIFKGLARALRDAVEIDPRKGGAIPSTKGTLG